MTILASDASRSELLELTAARGFAALMVVIFHIDAYAQGVIASRLPLDVLGLAAVDFFFVLSGFVLAHVYEGPWRKGTYDHVRFLIRRFARIWPLHLAGLLAVAAIVFAGRAVGLTPPWTPTASSFLAHLTMLHATGITPELAWNQPSWSVGAEWTAYLTFPLYLMVASRLRSPAAKLAAAAALFALCWAIAKLWLGRDLMTLMHDGGALRIVPSFFLGVVLREIFGAMARRPGALALSGLFGLTLGAAGALLAFGA
ncbi:acyltransferase family protein, partial [Methylopila musalis]